VVHPSRGWKKTPQEIGAKKIGGRMPPTFQSRNYFNQENFS
jgi:hypothetical protein